MTDTSYMVMDYHEPQKRPQEEPRECSCGYPYDRDGAFLVDGVYVCTACFLDWMESNCTPGDLADALGIDNISQEAAEYGHA